MKTLPQPRRWTSATFLGIAAVVFGAATLKEGGGVLFGDAATRLAAGHYVPFVLWVNFVSGFVYVVAGVGIALGRLWGARLGAALAVVSAVTFAALGAHIAFGRAFESRTVMAMTLRSLFWVAATWRAYACMDGGSRGRRSAR